MSEDDLNVAMDRRVELFLAELQRWGKTDTNKGGTDRTEVNVHLQASVVWNLGCLRLQCAVTFYDFAKDGVAEVTGLVFHPVDAGDEAKRNLYPTSGGSGTISSGAKAKVLNKITWFVEDASGTRIGQVVQENDVPTGQLDNNWGEDAFYAAQGARDGIMELLKSSGALDA